jgi:hypothetical protein
MTFQRVVLTAKELREYRPAFPTLDPHPLKTILESAHPTVRVSADFAFAVAIDLMGLDLALDFVRKTPAVLTSWITLIETHGWGGNLKQYDLQINLLLNAIKQSVARQQLSAPERETSAYQLIRTVAKNNVRLENALVSGLILNKGLDLPWVLSATLPRPPFNENFGVWTDLHYGQ